MITLNITGVNEELKKTARWVLWQLEDVQDGDKLRKNMKPPYDAKSGERAKHNDFSTWTTYDVALTAHQKNIPLRSPSTTINVHPVRGIGVVVGSPFFGIDLDDCRNVETGEIEADALKWIEELDSYTEISPSGTGVHIWCHGEPPYPEGHRKDKREIYSTNRYLTITGAVIEGHEEIRRFEKPEVKGWYERVKAGKNTLSKRANNEPSGGGSGTYTAAKITDMMSRIDYPDLSQAVQSLLTLLAIEHRLDAVKIETAFKESRLYTDTHWKEKWERLGAGELKKAIEYGRENIDKQLARKRPDEPATRKRLVLNGADVEPTHAKYMWEPVLPLGKLIHFGGASSQGKSPVTVDIAARITSGAEWPDGQKNTQGPKDVIMFNVEDSFEDTILPRFILAGGDRKRLFYFKGVTVTKGDQSYEAIANFQDDLLEICEEARSHPELGLIIVDPATNHLGKAKMNAEEEVRQILTPIAALAEELQICAITVGHLNKSKEMDPLQRMMGAAAFVGVARSVYLFDKDDSTSPYDHVMAPCRGQMGSSYKYSTSVIEKEWGGDKSKIVKISWKGTVDISAEDLVGIRASKKDLSLIQKAGIALRDYLKSGKRPAAECISFLRVGGFDMDKLGSTRVRKAAGADIEQKERQWFWFLPTARDLFQPVQARLDDAGPTF